MKARLVWFYLLRLYSVIHLRSVEKLIKLKGDVYKIEEEIRTKVKQAGLDCGLQSQDSKYYTVIH